MNLTLGARLGFDTVSACLHKTITRPAGRSNDPNNNSLQELEIDANAFNGRLPPRYIYWWRNTVESEDTRAARLKKSKAATESWQLFMLEWQSAARSADAVSGATTALLDFFRTLSPRLQIFISCVETIAVQNI